MRVEPIDCETPHGKHARLLVNGMGWWIALNKNLPKNKKLGLALIAYYGKIIMLSFHLKKNIHVHRIWKLKSGVFRTQNIQSLHIITYPPHLYPPQHIYFIFKDHLINNYIPLLQMTFYKWSDFLLIIESILECLFSS